MIRVYECIKKGEMLKILEADPYAEDSFARVGYTLKDGAVLDEEKGKTYLYISASEDFIKKADERLKDVAGPVPKDMEERIGKKIKDEESEAESGFGSLFG